MTARPLRNFADLVRDSAARFGDQVFLLRRDAKGGDPTSFAQLAVDTQRIAAGLIASGVQKGDRVGLIAENRREWLVADLACAWFGAVDVPRGTDTSPTELAFLLDHAGCSFVFVETAKVAGEILAHRDRFATVTTLCLLDEVSQEPEVLDFATLARKGDAWIAANPGRLDQLADAVTVDDPLTVIYTSGTTANPKGVTLTHGNLIENIRMVEEVLHFDREDCALSVLPSWHSYERIMDYVLLYAGGSIVYSDRRRMRDDLRAVKPTIFVAVPRVWEMIHDGIVTQCRKQAGMRRRVLEFVLANCRAIGAGTAGFWTRFAQRVVARGVLPRFLEATGGRMRIAVSGGGSLPAHVDECLLGMGLPLLNGYGLTETSPVVALRRPDENRPHTIGRPLPRTQCEIRDESGHALPVGKVGTIWIRGPQVMRGYWRNPEQTDQVIVDGWFNSGDLGCFDAQGELRITGRAKDTIVLAGGENAEPERIETQLKTSPLIEQVVVVGQDQKHLGALIVASTECLEQEIPRSQWEADEGVLRSDEVNKRLRAELDRLITREAGFRAIERIATFRVLIEPMTADNGLMTHTMKVKRHVVVQRFAALLDEMFHPAGDD